MAGPSVVLKRGRAKPVLQRHPWVFSGAIERIEGEPDDGDTVEVHDAGGNWLARGTLNRHSQIVVRLLTWERDEPVDADFWGRRLARALAAREGLAREGAGDAYRLIHAESDFLPGLIVDRYGEYVVAQFLTLGAERWQEPIVAALADLAAPRGIFERSDVDVRAKEGLEARAGPLWGDPPPALVEIHEGGHRFLVDIYHGHKTGFYLDQRENRARLLPFCAGAEVLDAFAYSGAFAVYAAAGGAARVTLVESSAAALALAQRNLALTGCGSERIEPIEADVFATLRRLAVQGRRFDVVILDPPKLAASAADVPRAARAYKDANRLAFTLLRPGGVLFTCSCSGAISAELFQKIIFAAALESGRAAQITGYLAQGADHPVALTFPEGAYLKGLICRVLD